MNTNAQNIYKVAGLALLVIGIGLVVWGFQMSGSVTAKVYRALYGSMPDGIMYRYLTGATSAAAGAFLLFKRS